MLFRSLTHTHTLTLTHTHTHSHTHSHTHTHTHTHLQNSSDTNIKNAGSFPSDTGRRYFTDFIPRYPNYDFHGRESQYNKQGFPWLPHISHSSLPTRYVHTDQMWARVCEKPHRSLQSGPLSQHEEFNGFQMNKHGLDPKWTQPSRRVRELMKGKCRRIKLCGSVSLCTESN